ncbi:MAG: PIG-L family deacetylase [Candidatus Heimdallarchaeota archaeon]|nr:PIG-L family deacetylase [Candidatus Heimdallarchaeota archaeon]MCK5142235.1 PIG-L family deacetylase [Candidatus Heimdallarchaeota archaeon]
MKLAFVFAHPDDEALSSGGTIAKYSTLGDEVSTLCLSSDSVRKVEYFNATKILGVHKPIIFDYQNVESKKQEITKDFIDYLLNFRPEIVVTHLENDYHIDHRATYNIVLEGIEWAAHETQHKNPHLVNKLYVAETTILIPNPHILVDISDCYDQKEEAIKCYKSQLSKGGDNFYINFHKNRTQMRGAQASTKHAEAFLKVPLKQNSPFYEKKHSEL